MFLSQMPPYEFIDLPSLRSGSFPWTFTRPESTAPGLGQSGAVFVNTFGFFNDIPVAKSLTSSIGENFVGNPESVGVTFHMLCFQTICPGDEEVRAMKESPGLRSVLPGVEFEDVKLGSCRVCVDHVLGALFVASQ